MRQRNLIGTLLVLAIALAIPSSAHAVNLSTTSCPGAGCQDYNVSNQATIGIQLTGTWVGTVTFQASIDGSTFVSYLVLPSNSTTAVTSTTGNGEWNASVSGLKTFRVVLTAYMSGTVVLTPQLSTLARRGGFGSGGTFSPCGSDTQILFNDGGGCGADAGLTYNKTTDALSLTGLTIDPSYITAYSSLLAAANGSIYIASNNDGLGSFIDMGLPGGATTALAIGYAGTRSTIQRMSDSGFTFTRNNLNPGALLETMSVFSASNGDNTTAIGTRTGLFTAADDVSVTAMTKGLLYAVAGAVQPKVDRDNSGIDDAVPFTANNIGTARATEAFYVGHNSMLTEDFSSVFTSESHSTNGIRIYNILSGGFVADLRSIEAADASLKICADDGDDATDCWTQKVAATGNAFSLIDNSVTVLSLSPTAGLSVGGSTPAVSDTSANSCGTGTETIVGNNNAGKVTVIGSAGTSCTVTFASSGFTNAPSCTASNETSANLARATSTATTVVLAGTFAQNDVIAYVCIGR